MPEIPYLFAMGPCYACGKIFSFHPERVPSLRDENNDRQPICRDCIERVNPRREANGLPPIVPLPGAYEPAPEGEQ